MTGWAMLGLEAAGRNPLDVSRDGHTPVDYLRTRAGSISSTGDIERTILALAGRRGRARAASRARTSSSACSGAARDDGSFDGQVNLTAFGILALRAAGEAARRLGRAAKWLRGAQNDDGGWGFQPGAAERPRHDRRGAAGARGRRRAAESRTGVGYLRATQRGDGGWALLGQSSSNSQSTAWAVQGLIAAGTDPAAVKNGGHSGLDYLAARQQGDGHYRYSKSSDQTPVWVTGQAMLAVERKPFPIAAVAQSGGSGSGAATGSGGFNGAGGPAAVDAAERGRAHTAAAEVGLEPVGAGGLPGGLPESELPHGATPAVPDGEIPQPRGGGKGETETAPAVTAQPSRRGRRHRRRVEPSLLRDRRRRARGGSSAWRSHPIARLGCSAPVPQSSAPNLELSRRGLLAGRRARSTVSRDGRRDRDPHPPHPQGVQARAGAARDARRALRARALGAQPPPDGPVALPRRRAARRSSGSSRRPGPRRRRSSTARRRWSSARARSSGDPVQDEEDLHATGVAAYIVLLAAHARGLAGYWRTPGCCAAERAATRSACPATSASSACSTSAGRCRSSARPSARRRRDASTYLD